MELLLYNFEGEELGFSDKVISSYRRECFNDIGSSEFHIEPCDPLANIIQENDFLILEQDGIFQDIVVGHKSEDDFTIYCRSLSWLLSKMIIPPQTISSSVSSLVGTLLESSFGCDITLGDVPSFTNTYNFETNKVTLFSDALKNTLDSVNGGHLVRFSHENNRFYLDILKGNNMNLYISEDEETLESLKTEKDLLYLSNSFSYLKRFPVISTWDAYSNSPSLLNNRESNFGKCYRVSTEDSVTRFGYSWETGDYIYCDNETGKWKKSLTLPDPIYVYISNKAVGNKYRWFHISNASSEEEGLSSLSEYQINQSFSAEPKNIQFLKDYKLGDFVTLLYKSNGKMKVALCQVKDITLSRDSLKIVENPTLKEVK